MNWSLFRVRPYCFSFLVLLTLFNFSSAAEKESEDAISDIIMQAVIVHYYPSPDNLPTQLSMSLSMYESRQSLLGMFKREGPIRVNLATNEGLTKGDIEQFFPFKEHIWDITSAHSTDEHLQAFGSFDQLRQLDLLRNQNVTNKGLSELLNLENLTYLAIPGAKVTFAGGVTPLSKLPSLETLDVSDIDFSAEKSVDLSSFKTLTKINLSGSGVKPENIINPKNIEVVKLYT